MKKCPVCKVVVLLAGLGAANWLLVGLLQKNAVTKLLGGIPHAVTGAYILIGISGLILLLTNFVTCCPCAKKGGEAGKEGSSCCK